MAHYKLIIIGYSGSGKSSYLAKLLQKPLEEVEQKTHTLTFETVDEEELSWTVTDGSNNWTDAHCAMIFYDCTSQRGKDSVNDLLTTVREICGDIPVVVCGNKTDLVNNGQVKCPFYVKNQDLPIDTWHVPISAQTLYNFDKPFLWLSRKLRQDAELTLVTRRIDPRAVMVAH